jgi:hypothetical protein
MGFIKNRTTCKHIEAAKLQSKTKKPSKPLKKAKKSRLSISKVFAKQKKTKIGALIHLPEGVFMMNFNGEEEFLLFLLDVQIDLQPKDLEDIVETHMCCGDWTSVETEEGER